VPLLLLDLDNTLVDRAAAYHRWAVTFVHEHGDRPGDLEWLIEADGDGFTPRELVAERIRDRFGLGTTDRAAVLRTLRLGLVEQLTLDPGVPEALDRARAAGWTLVVVTNGTVEQQERKLRRTGLDTQVAGWVISEGAGIRKPDPRIFRLAAQRAGRPLEGAWMIGDCIERDIGGAQACGLRSVWLRRGRVWPADAVPPTAIADTLPEAVDHVLAG
jgi:putative hydrolase of the HAD superfamily